MGSLSLLAVVFVAALVAGYHTYGRWIARQFRVDDGRQTPAHQFKDGIDYVPTRPFYLFGQHFSAIAAAGPIAGPILACQLFGWAPALLWIGLGVILIGAVHDFSSLTASVRHGARSIADITREHLGDRAGLAMLIFIWIAIVYVIIAFADITAGSFVSATEELQAADVQFNPGGAVAAASVLYLLLAVTMGVVQRVLNPPLWLLTIVFVPAALGASWVGTMVSDLLVLDFRTWALLILVYCCIASVMPVWSLLQPRGYLGGFVLYLAIGLGVMGVFFGGYEVQQDAFKGFSVGGVGTLMPFLFVTIACGACSGFHGLVCSGTTSKQIDRESHLQPVGYGAMLAEGLVALIALVTIMIVTSEDAAGLAPGTIYGNGVGQFLTLLIGPEHLAFAVTFGAMAFSTFVFDTLDVCTRLGRYIAQEVLQWQGMSGMVGGTLLTMALPFAVMVTASEGTYIQFWTLFGASNQLLAALTLLSITVWLYQNGQRFAFTLAPAVFMFIVTIWALGGIAAANLQSTTGGDVLIVNGISALLLMALAVYLAATALSRVRRERVRPPSAIEAS